MPELRILITPKLREEINNAKLFAITVNSLTANTPGAKHLGTMTRRIERTLLAIDKAIEAAENPNGE